MYTISTLLLIAAIALVAGLGGGVIISRSLSQDGRKQRELERNLDRLLQQQKDYQHEVVEHFTDTAKLLNKLAESYREVHNHLASGANTLCDDQAGNILGRIPENSMSTLTTNPDPGAVQPPLDYAPKMSPYETGVLNEEFGLDKQPEEQPDLELVEDTVIPRQA